MGSSGMDKATKDAKEVNIPTSEEPAMPVSAGTAAPDWSGIQAYSPIPAHGYLAPSPQTPHPYMWGVQHLVPPYGTSPHPYVAMYPHGGMYPHPSITPGSYPFSPFVMPSPNSLVEPSGNTPGIMEVDGKAPEGTEKLPIKRSRESLAKSNEAGKSSGAAANDGYSKSGRIGSEGSYEEVDDASSENDSQAKLGNIQDSLEGEASHEANMHDLQNGGQSAHHIAPVTAAGTSGVPNPVINLNVGMDYWNSATPAPSPAIGGKVPSAPVAEGIVNLRSRQSMQSQPWLQDERELKRQKRKMSNRESARRSRLRKQAECEGLAQRTEALAEENDSLRADINRVRIDYEQQLALNASLKERLGLVQEDLVLVGNDQSGKETEQSEAAESAQGN